MSFDYSGVVSLATSLITQFGRQVTLIELDKDPANVAQPWRGATDPEATPDNTETAYAVMVPPSSADQLGLGRFRDEANQKRLEGIFIIGATTADMNSFDQILDGSTRYFITGIEKLNPGASTVLHFVAVGK